MQVSTVPYTSLHHHRHRLREPPVLMSTALAGVNLSAVARMSTLTVRRGEAVPVLSAASRGGKLGGFSRAVTFICVDVGMLLPKYNGTREIFLNGLWGVLVTGHMMWDDL